MVSLNAVDAGLAAGDSTPSWAAWSAAAEGALADAYCLAGGPLPVGGTLRLGRGRLVPYQEKLGGVQMIKARLYRSNPGEADDVAGYCTPSLVPVLRLRRRLKVCIDIAASIMTHVFSLARSFELSQQWEKVLAAGPVGPVTQVEFLGLGGLQEYHAWVVAMYNQVVELILICNVVIHRKEHNIKAWRTWVLEDRSLSSPKVD